MSLVCDTPGRPYMMAFNAVAHLVVLFRPRCKLWSCPACAEINRARWCVRSHYACKLLVELGNEIEFVTLTSHPALGPEASVAVLRSAWDQLNKRARRAQPGYEYVLIPERHQDGRVHMHLLTTATLVKRWWKKNAAECGLGYIADAETLRSPEGGAWYTSKYISKQMDGQQWPPGFRRVRTSRGWPKLPEVKEKAGWTFRVLAKQDSLQTLTTWLDWNGYDVILCDHREAWRVLDTFPPS